MYVRNNTPLNSQSVVDTTPVSCVYRSTKCSEITQNVLISHMLQSKKKKGKSLPLENSAISRLLISGVLINLKEFIKIPERPNNSINI